MTTSPNTRAVELNDIQGLVRFGYKHHTQACFLLLRVKDRDAARAWLASVAVTNATTIEPPPETALNVALSSAGLHALGVPGDVVDDFSPEFVSGLGDDANRTRRLGDVGANEPGRWQWGVGPRVPHVLVLLYALPGRLDDLQRATEGQCEAGFETIACLATVDMDGIEPFGFVDGISQPQLDWERERRVRDEQLFEYTNLSCLGEFLLGYPNEYGAYTERPLLEPERDALALLPRSEDVPAKVDLGRNGSYLVMRQLRQDVHGFWQFVDGQSGGDADLRKRLAAVMVGRTLDGEPLVAARVTTSSSDGASSDLNAFDYEADPRGVGCPLGAHVRRTNPRNADLPSGEPGLLARLKRTLGFDAQALERDRVASTRFHRILRRGREYGPEVPLAQALVGQSDGADPGLHFICLGANIARQFEFIQEAWITATHFDRLSGESDPLLGTRLATPGETANDGFSIPQASGPDRRITGLPQFVTVLGGGYFFLPGIRALRYLATAR